MGDEPAGPVAAATGADAPRTVDGDAGPEGAGGGADGGPVLGAEEDREGEADERDEVGARLGACSCTWCGAWDPGVVPLVVGRGRRRRVVAAICPDCVDGEPASAATAPLLFAFGALALASFWVWSTPGGPSRLATAAIAASWVVAVAAYGVQAARAARAARQGAPGAPRSWRWAVPPLLGALVAVAVLLALPLRARFALSRAAIASAAADASPGVGRHGRLVAFPSGLLQRTDAATGVLVDARCGFFRAEPAAGTPAAPGVAGQGAGQPADPGSAVDGAPGGSEAGLVDVVSLGGGWRAGCLTLPVTAAEPLG